MKPRCTADNDEQRQRGMISQSLHIWESKELRPGFNQHILDYTLTRGFGCFLLVQPRWLKTVKSGPMSLIQKRGFKK